jgi:hypothetical protein
MSGRQEFINTLKGGPLLPEAEWKEKTNLYTIWKQRVKPGDIRYELCSGDPEVFVSAVYRFLRDHLDEFLGAVYDSAFTDKGFRDIDRVNIIDSKTICNTPNNPGYFRNVCFQEIVECGGDADIKLSIRNSIKNTLNGKIRKTFFMPALFRDVYNGVVSPNMVLTFNKSCKLASILSPNVYRHLLRVLRTHTGGGSSILFPTASWGVPVVAADGLGYETVDIVDVQGSVLDKCHTIKDTLFSTRNPLFSDQYTLGTYCTPSEIMDKLIDRQYDHIISCPPYYDLEVYGCSDNQSTDLYRTYPEWLENYWRKTVVSSRKLLKGDGVFSFIMGHHIRYQYMSRDMVDIAISEGFHLVDEIKIIPKRKSENIYMSPIEKFEVCSIFKK